MNELRDGVDKPVSYWIFDRRARVSMDGIEPAAAGPAAMSVISA